MSTRYATLIAAALLLLAGNGYAAEDESPRQVLFKNVHVWDGSSDGITKRINVLVEGNLIKKLRAADADAHGEALVIDGDGRTLMPGLIDQHVHLSTFLPLQTHSRDMLHPYAHGALAVTRAREVLMNGYTTVRDLGGPANYLRKIVDAGVAPGPRIYPTENWITTTSGHGDFRELNDPHPNIAGGRQHFYEDYVTTIADGPDETTRAVREAFRRGATQIKLFTSGGVTSLFDPLHSGPNPEEIRAAVAVAKRWDTYVATHSFSEAAINLALDNGVLSIEHAPFLTDAAARKIIEKGAFMATAVGPVLEVPVEVAQKTYPPASFKKWKVVRDAALNMLEVIKNNPELKVTLGSDLLGTWDNLKATDDKMNLEFKYFPKYIGNLRTLKMATSTAGEMNAMTGKMNPYPDGKLGVVQEGAYADLLLVDGNPLDDIELLLDPDKNFKIIMKDGVIYKNSLLYDLIEPELDRRIKATIPHMYGDYNYIE